MNLLMFGYRPPPVFGPSVAYENLMQSDFAKKFDVRFINLSVVENIRQLEKVRPGKILKFVQFALTELWLLATRRFDFCCYPLSYNRNAFLKDYVLVSLARSFRVPVVFFAHGTGLAAFRQSLSPQLRARFERMVQRAAGVLVLAETLRSDFAGLLPDDKIFVVPIGIEARPMPARQPTGQFTILYLGALFSAKGIFDLLAAMAFVPDAKLIVAGEWFRADEEQKARQMKNDRIEFVGPVAGEQKWKLLRSVDLFVFPPHSAKEAFGIVLLEAMQAGLPIVATRGGARDEIITDGVNGLLAEEQNPADLAAKIRLLAGNPALREKMGEANRQKFAGHYTREHFAQRMINVFENLSARPSPSPPQT